MLLSTLCSPFIHPQLRPIVAGMRGLDAILFLGVHLVDKLGLWHKLPVFLGLAYLGIRRSLHNRYNLLAVGKTVDGTEYDALEHGTHGTFFGRNVPSSTSTYGLMDPHPSVVASKLLARKEFTDTGKQFNMIAASWIQFMIHDWIDHMEDTHQVEIKAPDELASSCPLKSFRFYKTKIVPTGSSNPTTGSLNIRTPWWDGSAIYGNTEIMIERVRTYKDGKLKITQDGLLEQTVDGVPISGDVRNGWAGLLTMQTLFVAEHNLVCDMLKENYPDFNDEELYRHARLVTSAIIAKIHTIDWTVELLKTNTLHAAMRINWYGILGKKFKDMFGHVFGALLSGLVGLKEPQDHGVPYSLTEEFTSVYRMHSMLPDELVLRDMNKFSMDKSPPIAKEVSVEELLGNKGGKRLSEIGMEQMMVSMGHQACGALSLWNYPSFLRKLVPQDINGEDRSDLVDLAALEIYRDRERKVSRYNEFRRNMLMIPISKWGDLTDDKDVIAALQEVYGNDVEKLDLLVGLHAEKKITGFAISETAFFIFLIMASRRLEADRFFTSDFNEKAYTKKGFEWVNKTETLKAVIDRHFPEMTRDWMSSSSAYSVWDAPPTKTSWIPLYLRPATS